MPASASSSGVRSVEPASTLTSAAEAPVKCAARPAHTAATIAGTVAALLYVGSPTTISHGARAASWRSSSGGGGARAGAVSVMP